MKRQIRAPLPLMQFIPRLSPRFKAPGHLAGLVGLFDRIRAGEEVHAAVSKPPRHGGTEVAKHGIAMLLLARPEMRIGIAMHSSKLTRKRSREIKDLYLRAGGRVSADAASNEDWRTGARDGGVWAGGIDSGFTGEGFDLLYVDDPIRDRARAESAVERDRLWDWWQSVALPRLEPGASSLVLHHRWHPDDMYGRLVKDGVEALNFPAIDAHGKALWPERYSLDQLQRIRERTGEYAFAGLYMGAPYLRGGELFADVEFFDTLPSGALRYAIGVDFAYTAKSRADYSTAVVLAEHEGTHYVVEVLRMQVTAPEFRAALEQLCSRYGGVRPFAWIGGTERGVLDMWRSQGFRVDHAPATVDKFTRAQAVSAAWGAGKVRVPRDAPWLDAFVGEVVAFTGVGDRHDDQVDALAAAHHRLADATDRIVSVDIAEAIFSEADAKHRAISMPVLAVAPPTAKRAEWLAAIGQWQQWIPSGDWRRQFLWRDVVDEHGRKVSQEIAVRDGVQLLDPTWREGTFFVLADCIRTSGTAEVAVANLCAFAADRGVRHVVARTELLAGEIRRNRLAFLPARPTDLAQEWVAERTRTPHALRVQNLAEIRDDFLRMRAGGDVEDLGFAGLLFVFAQADLDGAFGSASPTTAPRAPGREVPTISTIAPSRRRSA